MESLLNRYRNITVLLLVIFAQLVLLAYQVKNDQDVRVIRIWAVTTVTPVARIVEWFRGGSIGFIRNYILLHDASQENRNLRDEVGRLRLENNDLRNELNTADRAKALQVFQSRTPSKMLAANVIMAGAGSNSNVVYVNRGSVEGVMRGMAVVTPDGIVGKVISSYPTASEVLLITDPDFAAGVISQKSLVRGTLKGQGRPMCKVDYVPFEDKVESGEWFYTSGDDRVFPRGFPVGVAKVVRPGTPFKDIQVEPSGLQHGMEDVLILMQSVHQAIPEAPPANQPMYIAPAPPAMQTPGPSPAATTDAGQAQPSGTEADKLRSVYKSVGDSQNHVYGVGPPGSKAPDFTKLPSSPLPPQAAQPGTNPAGGSGPGGQAAPKSAGPTGAAGQPLTRPVNPAGGTGSAGQAAPPKSAGPTGAAGQPLTRPVNPAGGTGAGGQAAPKSAGTGAAGQPLTRPVSPAGGTGPGGQAAPKSASPIGTSGPAPKKPASPSDGSAPAVQAPPKSGTPAKGAPGGPPNE